ncbi:hypothetical protein ACO0LM_04975 [Undibacterium sp. Di26W]|uniref:hypothetical protein n=1 Tax=Undibacterium sp. Di26W TaxID=3413035 RepID=UPI003BF25524
MQALTFKMRALLFLYSTQNLLGSCLAILGLGMYFTGVILDWWLPIVVGLYAVAWLAIPADKELELQIKNENSQSSLTDSVDALIRESKSRLPHEAVERLHRIQTTLQELAPKIFSGEVAMNYVSLLINAVNRDLPQTIKNYVLLPTAFATMHVIENGKTCKQLLLEQLDLLETQLSKIATDIYKNNADSLLVNGEFLKEKFHTVTFVQ